MFYATSDVVVVLHFSIVPMAMIYPEGHNVTQKYKYQIHQLSR